MAQFLRYNQITPGTTLRVYCPSKGVYHYGIATYGNKVIDRAPRRGIARRSWDEFSEGQQVEIVQREQGDYSLSDTHSIALQCVGNPHYNIIDSNCEQFVNICRRGKSESKQVKQVGEYAVLGALFIGVLSFLSGGWDSDKGSNV